MCGSKGGDGGGGGGGAGKSQMAIGVLRNSGMDPPQEAIGLCEIC